MRPSLKLLKTTLIGGLVFLLPVIVALALAGQVVSLVVQAAAPLAAHLPADKIGGIAVGTLLAVGVLLLICYGAGVAARAAAGRLWSEAVEDKLHALYPRYTVIKGMTQGLYSEPGKDQLRSVLVSLHDRQQIGFEIERAADGRVVVFLPGSPDPWTGGVALVEPARVQALEVDFSRLNKSLAGLGRGMAALLDSAPPAGSQGRGAAPP